MMKRFAMMLSAVTMFCGICIPRALFAVNGQTSTITVSANYSHSATVAYVFARGGTFYVHKYNVLIPSGKSATVTVTCTGVTHNGNYDMYALKTGESRTYFKKGGGYSCTLSSSSTITVGIVASAAGSNMAGSSTATYYANGTYKITVTYGTPPSPAKSYTVRFNSNDGKGYVATRTYAVGSSQSLPWYGSDLGWAALSGYTFLGWSASSSATSATYANGARVYNLAAAGGTINLYAVWKRSSTPAKTTYTVRFNSNDGLGRSATRTFTTGTSQSLPWYGAGLGWTQRSGYTFLGWSTSSSATSATYANGARIYNLASGGGTVNLYAIWKRNLTYTIRFNINDGRGYSATRTFTTGTSQALPWFGSGLGWTVRSGYSFLGWSTIATATSSASKAMYANGQKVYNLTTSGNTINLYGVWKRVRIASGK